MGKGGAERLDEVVFRETALSHRAGEGREPFFGASDARTTNAHVVLEDAKTKEVDALARVADAPRVESQPLPLERLLERVHLLFDGAPVVPKEGHVVHVAEVRAHPQPVFRAVVDRREVSVREVLAREVADGQPD